jgi:peptidoglycan/xylan/chitin deacetylase (PgdA/CDA1 family)
MKKIPILLILLILVSCSRPQTKGGIIFTFDDQSVQNWVEYKDLLKKYDIRATFFVARPQLLDQGQINGLKALQSDGNEIACHGENHIDARLYRGTADSFYKVEAEPAISKMNDMGFKIVSYAYAFGLAPDSIDRVMLKHVRYLRKATWNMYNTLISNYDKIYARPDSFNVVSSMGIDCNYNIDLNNLEAGIERAEKNDEILVLHAHIIDASGLDYTINPTYLEQVFKLCEKDKIRSFRMQDLEDFFSNKNTTDEP